jgi:hypothetical protein
LALFHPLAIFSCASTLKKGILGMVCAKTADEKRDRPTWLNSSARALNSRFCHDPELPGRILERRETDNYDGQTLDET